MSLAIRGAHRYDVISAIPSAASLMVFLDFGVATDVCSAIPNLIGKLSCESKWTGSVRVDVIAIKEERN